MRRSVPHYTCKKIEQSSVTCVKTIIDYISKKKIYEKKITDYSDRSNLIIKELTKKSPWNIPILYDLALFAKNKFEVTIVKEKNIHIKDPIKDIESYSKKKEKECLEKGVKQEINSDIENVLIKKLQNSPVILFINGNFLYKQRNAGLIWIIVLEYNKTLDEFIIYDPMYYTRLPRTRNWVRIINTPKMRYISFKYNYFMKVWRETSETTTVSTDTRVKKRVVPFTREFLIIRKKM